MTIPTWPASLPQAPLERGLEESWPRNVARSQMDVGPPKTRRRSSLDFRRLTVSLWLTGEQVATLDSFIRNDLGDGARRFSWTHPRTGAAVELRFVTDRDQPPMRVVQRGKDRYVAEAELEVLP